IEDRAMKMKFKKFNMKDFDFKQFLIQKGERVAMWAAVGFMALLVVLAALSAILSASPSAKAGDLDKATKAAKSHMATKPGEKDKEEFSNLPGDLTQAESPRPIDPSPYAQRNSFFYSNPNEDLKWREPHILGPDEFTWNYVRGGVQSNYLVPSGDEL